LFVYRNFVKALPWFTQVREKLEDSSWWGFFLHKKTPTSSDATGTLYHDEEQTPRGDCGKGVACGEYLWNHSNGSMLTEFLVQGYTLDSQGLGSPYVDGFYIVRWTDERRRGSICVALCSLPHPLRLVDVAP
jgi:hypothetical protein